MKGAALAVLAAVGVGAVVLAFAMNAHAAPASSKVRIVPHCRYRATWESRPAIPPAAMQSVLHAANTLPGVQNVEASSTKDATQIVIDVLNSDGQAHDVQPGADTNDFGGLRFTLVSVTQLDCE